jgi:cell division transport system ATP-binding protein
VVDQYESWGGAYPQEPAYDARLDNQQEPHIKIAGSQPAHRREPVQEFMVEEELYLETDVYEPQPQPGFGVSGEMPMAGQPAVMPGIAAGQPVPHEMGNRPLGVKPVIVFDRVSKTYPSQPKMPALNNVSLQIFPGEFMFLVGHSGSGKSTFIRLINREIVATSGKLVVAGEDLMRMRRWRVPYLRRNIGCVFQDFKLLPNKTAFANVAFGLEVIGKSKHIIRTQVPEVLRLVGLEDKTDKLPEQLSGGEQQRVSIARAIVNRPPLLICDEPTGNLDPQTSLGIMRLLDRINRTGTTIVVATHDREMVDSMRKRVVALENGTLVRDQDRGVYGIDA